MSPINRSAYPANWESISRRIRFERAQGRCERCGVAHGAVGARDANGLWRDKAEIDALLPAALGELYPTLASRKMIKIVLTCAHLNRDESSDAEMSIAAYCQRCHLAYDRHDNWQRRRRNQLQRWVEAGQKAFSFAKKENQP